MISVGIRLLLSFLILHLTLIVADALNIPKHYRSQPDLERFLKVLNIKHPERSFLYSIGKSVAGRNLNVIAIAARDPDVHKPGRPEVKYVANIHGDETVGRELLLIFAEYLLVNPDRDPRVTHLLNTTRVHLLPSLNPDGFDVSVEGICDGDYGRQNARELDLNRNFPDYFQGDPGERQEETIAIMRWLEAVPFILSGSFHGGALVANYPFDNTADGDRAYSDCPDDDVFRKLASVYVAHHPQLRDNNFCEDSPTFPGGITNGADWYPVRGGMQDYNYIHGGALELTLEVSCCKYPIASELRYFWELNRESMLQLLMQVNSGVRGFIKAAEDMPIFSRLQIQGRNIWFNTTSLGEYWRILLPGQYVLVIVSHLFPKTEVSFTVHRNRPTICNVTLSADIEGLIYCDDDENSNLFNSDVDKTIKKGTVPTPAPNVDYTSSEPSTLTSAGSEPFSQPSLPETASASLATTTLPEHTTAVFDESFPIRYRINSASHIFSSTRYCWIGAILYPLAILLISI